MLVAVLFVETVVLFCSTMVELVVTETPKLSTVRFTSSCSCSRDDSFTPEKRGVTMAV